MYRYLQKELVSWFAQERRKPIILRGARQVGKSTLVRLVAEDLNITLYEINLERHLYLDEIFRTQDMDRILEEIEGITGRIKNPEKSLLFLDEIQATPHAIQSLRYFYEDRPQLAVIAAGSLLEFTLADHNFSMPVGRILYYHLGPLSFEEFLLARDEELFRFLESYTLDSTLPDSRHEKLLKILREYYLIGGMPEAVAVWLRNNDWDKAREIQRSILETYTDDFAKYARKEELARLQKIFRSIPVNVGKKVKYRNFSQEDKAFQVKSALLLLSKAGICTPIYHSDCSGLPLGAGINDKVFKLIFLDIGLINNLLNVRWHDLRLANEGDLAEQFAGQELRAAGGGKRAPELFYWLREGKGKNAEVDYVVTSGREILPVEIKSGSSGTLKSLHQFIFNKRGNKAVRFDLNKPGIQQVKVKTSDSTNSFHEVEFTLISLPLYMAGILDRLLEKL